MRGSGILLAVAAFTGSALACNADSSGPTPGGVDVAPSIVFPRGVLDKVTAIHLQVFETSAGIDCSAATATTTGIPTGPSPMPAPIAEADLLSTGCAPGFFFCGTVGVSKSDSDRVFAAVAKGAGNVTFAVGCVRANINQEQTSVAIRMVRFVPPATCGNGTVEPGETCDPGTNAASDPLCNNCQTSEIELSIAGPGGTSPPSGPGDKSNPFLLWPAGGDLFAFYSDHAGGTQEVSLRVLSSTMGVVTALGKAVELGAIFLPDDANTFPPAAESPDVFAPAAVAVGSKTFVVFEDLNSPGMMGVDIHLRSMDSSLQADQPLGQPCGINGDPNGAGESGVQSFPQVAVSGGVLFIVWQDEGSGKIKGRTYTPNGAACGALGAEQEISTGSSNSHAVVAPSMLGWVVAWQNGSVVDWRAIAQDGTPTGGARTTSTSGAQVHPSIASLGDGSFAITWSDLTNVFAQRYDAMGKALGTDAQAQINGTTNNETTPVIASTSAAGGAYVIAWVDGNSPNQVRARFVSGASGSIADGTAFLFNTVDGQATEFQVSGASNHPRANPSVVVGGASPYIAFAWEDKSTGKPGIFARRFPPPSQ